MISVKEKILNYVVNRWGRNKKVYVGATSESVRRCKPKSLQEWKDYYKNIKSEQHIESLGKFIYKVLREVVRNERLFDKSATDTITEQDCIEYMKNLVIKRVFDGYMREKL